MARILLQICVATRLLVGEADGKVEKKVNDDFAFVQWSEY